MMSSAAAQRLAILTPIAASLVAVSLALLVLVPAFMEMSRGRLGIAAGAAARRAFRRQYWLLFGSVSAFVVGTLLGVTGLWWETRVLASAVAFAIALGVLLLLVSAYGVARSVARAGI